PHWNASRSMKVACNGCSGSPLARPSMVVISGPSASAASQRHDLTRLPSIRTVQAPHWPRPQPFFEPVSRRCSRRASRSVVRGSSVSRCSAPFTRNTTSSGAGAPWALCAAAPLGAPPGKNRPAASAPPVAAVSVGSSRRVRPPPQVAEQHVGGVLHDLRRHRAELLPDARGALRLGGLVEGKELR